MNAPRPVIHPPINLLAAANSLVNPLRFRRSQSSYAERCPKTLVFQGLLSLWTIFSAVPQFPDCRAFSMSWQAFCDRFVTAPSATPTGLCAHDTPSCAVWTGLAQRTFDRCDRRRFGSRHRQLHAILLRHAWSLLLTPPSPTAVTAAVEGRFAAHAPGRLWR